MRFHVTLLLAVSLVAPGASAQNLLTSPDFDVATDVDDWPDPFPDPNTTIGWQSDLDVDASPSSGSLRLETSISNGAADGPLQCVDSGAGFYEVEAWSFNPTQSPQPVTFVAVDYFPGAGCTGTLLGSDSQFAPSTLDAWVLAEDLVEAPSGTVSLGMRLFSGNTIDPTVATVYYDAIYLPEPGRGSALACGLLALAFLTRRRD